MRIDALRNRPTTEAERRARSLNQMKYPLRDEAFERWYRAIQRWAKLHGPLISWAYGLIAAGAKTTTLYPKDSAWGRRQRAKKGGRARQAQLRSELGEEGYRDLKRNHGLVGLKKRWGLTARLNIKQQPHYDSSSRLWGI